jgi:hypothetical protein
MLRQLLNAAEVELVMRSERECAANQLEGGRRVRQRVKAVAGGARGAVGVPVPAVQALTWVLLVRQGVRLLGEGM